MSIEFRVVPVTKWAVVECRTDGSAASSVTIGEVGNQERAEQMARFLTEKYGRTFAGRDDGSGWRA